MDTNYEKNHQESPDIKNDYYRQLIGKLLHTSINSRPDISAPVAILSQHIKGTRQIDWDELQRVCRYLKTTKNYQLQLKFKSSAQELVRFANANWAEDRTSRKSNTGYVFLFFSGAISWTSKKQSCAPVSSTEAEIVALSEASRKCVLIRDLLDFLELPQNLPTTIYKDNQGCISNIRSSELPTRSKHIDTQYFYTRDLEEKGIIKIIFHPSESNVADILIKPLGSLKTSSLTKMIGLTEDGFKSDVIEGKCRNQ